VFIAMAVAMRSLGHGLRLIAVPCIPSGSLNRVPASVGLVNGGNVNTV